MREVWQKVMSHYPSGCPGQSKDVSALAETGEGRQGVKNDIRGYKRIWNRGFIETSSEESTSNAGDMGLTPESGRSPREENGNSLQYSYLGNLTDKGDWSAVVHGVVKSQTQLSE